MVTKHFHHILMATHGLNLAKIHMVTKQGIIEGKYALRLNLAKIHMVTKQLAPLSSMKLGLNLAKIHMVTKRV